MRYWAIMLIAAGMAVAAAPRPARAAETAATGPLAGLAQCRGVADGPERLACYDKAVDTLTAATARKDVVVMDRAEMREARHGLFGFSLPRLRIFGNSDAGDEPEHDLVAKVASARQLGYGKWRFTLDSGAVWETTEADRSFDGPKVGQDILLQRGALGGYFAKVGKQHRVAAQRVG